MNKRTERKNMKMENKKKDFDRHDLGCALYLTKTIILHFFQMGSTPGGGGCGG